MTKSNFKKFNAREYVEAVQLTDENLHAVATEVRGVVDPLRSVISVPTISGAIEAYVGDYIYYEPDDNLLRVIGDEDFEANYVVPKKRVKSEDPNDDN